MKPITDPVTPTLLASTVQPLIAWYSAHRKELPWRNDPTPYHVWISEIMLQQTRIEAALPYYERFLRALPTVEALAACEDDALMKLWQGLGYYSRARNLKKAAQVLVKDYDGKLPDDAVVLKKLPGIGDYTAGAIASIAYGKPEPAVDGNVLRVVMRLAACEADVMQNAVRADVAEKLRAVYPSGKDAGVFTEALMELGETVCLPNTAPKCDLCPLRELCAGFRTGTAETLPIRSKPTPRKIEQKTVFLLKCGEKYALRKREAGLLGGMWEFPNLDGHLTPEKALAAVRTRGGCPLAEARPLGKAKHVFSHIEWHMIGYEILLGDTFTDKENALCWASAEEIRAAYAVPTAFRGYMAALS